MIKLSTTLSEHNLQVLANVEQSDFWQIVKEAVDAELEMLENEIRKAPKFCDEDLTQDLRFKMGGVDRLKWVLELPRDAREIVTKR